MKRNAGGFTLLEVCLSFALFAIMMEGMMVFYSNICLKANEYKQLKRLESEAGVVQDFIRYYIRTADEVTVVADVSNTQEIEEASGGEKSARTLKYILCTFKIPNQKKADGVEIKNCKVNLTEVLADKEGKGKYKLTYGVLDDKGIFINNNLISDMIEQIIVYEDPLNQSVEFECFLKMNEEKNEKLQVAKSFVESLKYKS